MITYWLAYIRLLDFDAKHVLVSKNEAADALLRWGYCIEDEDLLDDKAVDKYFEAKLYLIIVGPVNNFSTGTNVEILCVYLNEAEYKGDDLILGKYLSTLP